MEEAVNRLPQTGHWCGFSPEWMRRWVLSEDDVENPLEHTEQTCGFSPVEHEDADGQHRDRAHARGVDLSAVEMLNSPVCVRMCLLSREGRSKLLPQTSQGSSVRSPRPTRAPLPLLRPGVGPPAIVRPRGCGEAGLERACTRGGRAAAGSSSVAASCARLSGSSSRSSDDDEDADDAADEVDRHDDSDSPDTDLCSSACSAPDALLDGLPAGCTAL